MKTTQLIEKLGELAQVGIVNVKDNEVLLEAATRLFELRAKADPRWNEWLIMDDGLFLESCDKNGETSWTSVKNDAISFNKKEDAEKFIRAMIDWCGHPVLRGDTDAFGLDLIIDSLPDERDEIN